MERRRLGASGPLVGCVGLGGMNIAGAYGPTDESQVMQLLAKAVDVGVSHFDTADVYGMGASEELIGRFLRGRRDKITIATKGAFRFARTTGERRIDNDPSYLRTCIQNSLKRLRREHIDLFYVHRRESERPIEEVIAALGDAKKEGLIGGIGLSEVSPETLRRAHKVHPISAVQSEYSIWTRQPEAGMLETCKELGVAFVAFSPLARGMLTSTPPSPDDLPGRDLRKSQPRFVEPNYSRNVEAIAKLQDVAARKDMTITQLALAWVLAQGNFVHAIPGTRSAEHMAENAKAAGRYLTSFDKKRVEEALPDGFPWGERYSAKQWAGIEAYG